MESPVNSSPDIDRDYDPVKRVYYMDDGMLVSKVLMDTEKVEALIKENKDIAAGYQAHTTGGVRLVARVPTEMCLKWLNEEGVPGFTGPEALDHIANKKLRDPDYKYLLTVPDNYRMMRHG